MHFREKYEERKKNGGGKACDEIVLNIVLIKMLLNFQELPGSNKYEGVGWKLKQTLCIILSMHFNADDTLDSSGAAFIAIILLLLSLVSGTHWF